MGKTKEIFSLLKDFRTAALNQPGSQHMLVIGTWENMESWHSWKENSKRKEFEAMLEIYQEGPTEYEEYLLGVSHLE